MRGRTRISVECTEVYIKCTHQVVSDGLHEAFGCVQSINVGHCLSFVRSFVRSLRSFTSFVRSLRSFVHFVRSFVRSFGFVVVAVYIVQRAFVRWTFVRWTDGRTDGWTAMRALRSCAQTDRRGGQKGRRTMYADALHGAPRACRQLAGLADSATPL